MKSYYEWGVGTVQTETILVYEETREVLVRYPKPSGGYFTVRVRQKPNPIGFHARLPGAKR